MINLLAVITHAVFGWPWIVLEDFDGELNIRRKRKRGPFWVANRWRFIGPPVRLCPDGTTSGLSYVHYWHDAFSEPMQRTQKPEGKIIYLVKS